MTTQIRTNALPVNQPSTNEAPNSKFFMIHHKFYEGKAEEWWGNVSKLMSDEKKFAAFKSEQDKLGFHNHTFMPTGMDADAFCVWEAKGGLNKNAMEKFINGESPSPCFGAFANEVHELNLELSGGQTPFPRFFKNDDEVDVLSDDFKSLSTEGVDPIRLIPDSYSDASVYEVRTYFHKSKDEFDKNDHTNLESGAYADWLKKFFGLVSTHMDVTNVFWRISGSENSSHPGPAYEGNLKNPFEEKYKDAAQVVQWTIRWDSKEHADQVWGKMFQRPDVMEHIGTHPYVAGFIRMESRYMNAVVRAPQRYFSRDKIYEVRNYTFDEKVAEWNEANRLNLAKFVNKIAKVLDTKGIKIASWHLAQTKPVTQVTSGPELAGVEKYDDTGVVPANLQWVVEWDSIEQCQETWGKMLADPKGIDALCASCGENPWWKVGKPLFGYSQLDSTYMVNCDINRQ